MSKCIDKYGWGIDIHDAFIINPEAAEDVRTWYCEFMDLIYTNSESILANYFASIGINASAQQAWNRLQSKVVPITTEFKCQPMALK